MLYRTEGVHSITSWSLGEVERVLYLGSGIAHVTDTDPNTSKDAGVPRIVTGSQAHSGVAPSISTSSASSDTGELYRPILMDEVACADGKAIFEVPSTTPLILRTNRSSRIVVPGDFGINVAAR